MKQIRLWLPILIVLFTTAGCYLWGGGGESEGPIVATPVANVTSPAASNTAEAPETSEPENQSTTIPNDQITIELREVVGGLDSPTDMTHAGDGSGWLFVAEKSGQIRIVRDGQLLPDPFLDIRDRVGSGGSEQGLLGITFHPNYENNGFVYVDYTDDSGDTMISRFTTTDAEHADASSEMVLLTQDQPASNHNGGQVAFGPDGYLYIAFGDGGGAGDSFGNSQNGQSLLAKILRIDVDNGSPYSIPSDNPFVDNSGFRGETWAYGLRNPWRFSFDRQTGEMYIADVGQGTYEEVNIAPSGQGGQNYGWSIMEGLHCYSDGSCDQTGLTPPVIEYDHSQGCSITGGYVYRGKQYPTLDGIYFFGDYCSGFLWGLSGSVDGEWHVARLLTTGIQLSSFGQDEAGELYALDLGGGTIYQITVPGS
jgi:glucose/arabinose dehydrogenase